MKARKILIRTLLVLLVAGLIYVGDLFLGNPISYGMVKWHSRQYLQETYPDQPLYVESIYHDWYSGGGYDVRVASETSRDTRFEINYNRLGLFHRDYYEMTVVSGSATLSRLYDEYRDLVEGALSGLPEDCFCMSGLSTVDPRTGQAYPLPVGIEISELELDKDYDVAALGAEYGYLSVSAHVPEEDLTAQYAAKLLLRIKTAMEKANIGFVSIDLFMSVQNGKVDNQFLGINGITVADLEAEDVASRLEEMRLEQLSYWNGPKTE